MSTDQTLCRQGSDVPAPLGARHQSRHRVLLHRSAAMAARSGFFVFPVAPLGKVPALKDLNWAEIATRDPAALLGGGAPRPTTSALSPAAGPGSPGTQVRPQRARAHLLVTVPLYMAWFESESGK